MLRKTLCTLAAIAGCSLSTLAQAGSELVLYTSQPNADAQATVDAFTAVHPDIEVKWVRDGTTKLMTRLRAELQSGASRADLLLIADSVTMESLKTEGHLQPYLSPEREHYDTALYEPKGYYYGTKLITTGIVRHVKAAATPTRWSDLADAGFKGQVAMPSPLYSGAALIHLATLTSSPDLGWEYYRGLAENGTQAQGGNGGVLKAVASGNKPYGVIVDFLAIREARKGSPIEFVFPQEGGSMVTEPVAIMKEAKNVAAAQKFVDFVLSREGQELVQQQGYLPASSQVASPEGFPDRSEIRLMPFDAAAALRDAEANKARFNEIFGG
ncbi:ABC transporter substrate-binding protein [Marinobacterium marinum]|uniref:ABC transporter substrate-binding protein n=1 Tax=Marinobacterium marinum TaxID=2756129 RepID=A0A7W2ACZ0_9GAMM|nr:ABC transporter substrate-binding protein [Marinobacterium marinum]MBA4502633.1 ABC transporter substrate-binding protein [Marinobacterium marinum]